MNCFVLVLCLVNPWDQVPRKAQVGERLDGHKPAHVTRKSRAGEQLQSSEPTNQLERPIIKGADVRMKGDGSSMRGSVAGDPMMEESSHFMNGTVQPKASMRGSTPGHSRLRGSKSKM